MRVLLLAVWCLGLPLQADEDMQAAIDRALKEGKFETKGVFLPGFTAGKDTQSVVVDQAHQVLSGNSGMTARRQPLKYAINPAAGIWLDYGKANLKFQSGDPKFNMVSPNRVDVLDQKRGRYYRIVSSKDRKVELSTSTLRPIKGGEPFSGFLPGTEYVITIGFEFPAKVGKPAQIAPVWAGAVRVAESKSVPPKDTPAKEELPPPEQMGDF